MWIELSLREASLVKNALANYYGLNNNIDRNVDNAVKDVLESYYGDNVDRNIDNAVINIIAQIDEVFILTLRKRFNINVKTRHYNTPQKLDSGI